MEKQKDTNPETYYQKVAAHFDEDAKMFEQRYQENDVLQKIRKDFRRHTEKFKFSHALEIGSGPGIDLMYFAGKYPDRQFRGIDVSPEMVRISNENIKKNHLENVLAKTGSVEDIPGLFPGEKFDMIYVYFGGLNTVYDLKAVVRQLYEVAEPGAVFVFTSVNRYYLMDFVYKSMKLKFGEATARFRNRWKGYSPGRDLPSKVYSASQIKKTFRPEFKFIDQRGYSIFYPPWFGAKALHNIPLLSTGLWLTDKFFQKTPLWNKGEYSLYIMKRN